MQDYYCQPGGGVHGKIFSATRHLGGNVKTSSKIIFASIDVLCDKIRIEIQTRKI
jgi:hypothetical protein